MTTWQKEMEEIERKHCENVARIEFIEKIMTFILAVVFLLALFAPVIRAWMGES